MTAPDYEARAREVVAMWNLGPIGIEDLIATALREADAAALERAAQEYGAEDLANVKVYCRHVAHRLRALASPAAEKRAEPEGAGAVAITSEDVTRLGRVYQLGCEALARDGQVAETFRSAAVAEEALQRIALSATAPKADPREERIASEIDDALAQRVATQTIRITELEAAIRWALGEDDDFPLRPAGAGAYWWRTELRERAKLAARAGRG